MNVSLTGTRSVIGLFLHLTLSVPKYLATLFLQGGGVNIDPPFTQVIAVIKGQTKKQMIKRCKKINFEEFLTVFTVT